MAVPPVLAVKATQEASTRVSKALSNDIYVKRWQSVQGKGKKKKVVDHELHVNPVSIGFGVLAIGAAATGLALAAWLGGVRVTRTAGAKKEYLVRVYDPTTVTVVDVPAQPATAGHWETLGEHGKIFVAGAPAVPAVTHQEVSGQRYVVTTLKGFPVKQGVLQMPPQWTDVLTQREQANGWVWDNIDTNQQVTDSTGTYQLQRWSFHNDGKKHFGTDARPGFLA